MVAKIVQVTASGKHTGEASCLFASEEHVFSGGADGLIKVSEKKKIFDLCQKQFSKTKEKKIVKIENSLNDDVMKK